jgi:hypothetical protein
MHVHMPRSLVLSLRFSSSRSLVSAYLTRSLLSQFFGTGAHESAQDVSDRLLRLASRLTPVANSVTPLCSHSVDTEQWSPLSEPPGVKRAARGIRHHCHVGIMRNNAIGLC